MNICHSEFVLSKTSKYKINYFYLSLTFMLTWILSFFIFSLIINFQQNHKIKTLDNKILASYKQVFPNAKQVINPKFRVEQLLKKYQKEASPFWKIISIMGDYPLKFNLMHYSNNHLNVGFNVPEFKDLENYKHKLTSKGLLVKQKGAFQKDKNVEVSLEISV